MQSREDIIDSVGSMYKNSLENLDYSKGSVGCYGFTINYWTIEEEHVFKKLTLTQLMDLHEILEQDQIDIQKNKTLESKKLKSFLKKHTPKPFYNPRPGVLNRLWWALHGAIILYCVSKVYKYLENSL